MKTNIVIDISPSYLAKFWVSSYGPKWCQPINLQDFLWKKWMMKFIFCMQINIEVFYKLIISFWVSVTRHAQSTQNKFAYFFNISIKAWGMNSIFCLQINIMIVSLCVCIDKRQKFLQSDTIILGVYDQAWPYYPK